MLLACLLSLPACGGEAQPEPPAPPTFAELLPRFFESLRVHDAATRRELPGFEVKLEAAAAALSERAERGEIPDSDREASGRRLFYAGFFLQGSQQALQDGLIKPEELLRPRRYATSASDDPAHDNEEYLARLARGRERVERSQRLSLRDNLSESVLANIPYQSEILRSGRPSAESLAELLKQASLGFAGLFNAMIMWRDPEQHALTEPHMEKLVDLVCSPLRYSCEGPGPLPMPPGAPRLLTREVAGPVMASDLLVRRAEALLQRADQSPATRMADLGEAMGRLKVAEGLLGAAQKGTADPALAHYPFTSNLPPRSERLQALLKATEARLMGAAMPPALPSADFYRSRDYRLVYQCVACHTRGPISEGVPQ
jgi:hypothetical protein